MKKLLLIASCMVLLIAMAGSAMAEDSASGAGPNWPHQESVMSASNALIWPYVMSVYPIMDATGMETERLRVGEKAEWNFFLFRYDEGIAYVDPEAFNISVVDAFRSGETIKIAISKNGGAPIYRSAVSPNAATAGIKVKAGDMVTVTISYPNGFKYGDTGSGYAISWVLNNTYVRLP